ncbi:hypothetical protein RB977_004711 [Vibrio harveyi]|uniref:hypothetical protein n=1 Tax=Vibrio harveyi TaxID=669 RepID=UPI002874DA3C|nr:hypothetical protein [Vibrio harveyi]
MTWWIAFIIAVLGWYFTSTQNAKNSSRSLINQEIKEARAKLHDIIVSCSSEERDLPLKPMSEDFIKMQTYIVSAQELDKLYSSYHLPYFRHIRIVSVLLSAISRFFEYKSMKHVKKFIVDWFVPQLHTPQGNRYSDFDLPQHTLNIRQSLTGDMEGMDEEKRLASLNLEYKRFCMAYQFVS